MQFARPPAPFDPLIDQIAFAARKGLDLLAIGMAVSLPHICSSLAKEDRFSGRDDYREWCEKHLNDAALSHITPQHLYSIRCGVAHQGQLGQLPHEMTRILFLPPNSGKGVAGKVGDAYLYGVVDFCDAMCRDAVRWYNSNRHDPIVRANSDLVMTYHPNGYPPYAVGFPVIA